MSIADTLHDIHQDVHSRFTYVSDWDEHQQIDHWESPEELDGTIRGDCDAFALACRKLCREKGIRSRLVECLTEYGERHLVLEAEGYVLDNRQPRVARQDDLPYTWLKISGYEPGDEWRAISGA